jgi:hypothetical protein
MNTMVLLKNILFIYIVFVLFHMVLQESPKKGKRQMTSTLLASEHISFEFPEDCRNFTGIDTVLKKLDWTLECRRRKDCSGTWDTVK